jgi:hypothetical protein
VIGGAGHDIIVGDDAAIARDALYAVQRITAEAKDLLGAKWGRHAFAVHQSRTHVEARSLNPGVSGPSRLCPGQPLE